MSLSSGSAEKSLEALQSLATVDRRPVPGNLPTETSPLGGWPQLPTGPLSRELAEGTRISLVGVRGKSGYTGTLLTSLGDGKWKARTIG